MSNYFFNFPLTNYSFGNNEEKVIFQKLNTYIDLFDQARDQITSYQLYNIGEFERPDTVSTQLYGTPNYGWTFFLLNENIRLQGWPLSNLDLYEQAKSYYPNIVLTTTQNLAYVQNIDVGDTVVLFSDTSQSGVVRRIDYDFGQIYIERENFFSVNSGRIIKENTELSVPLSVPFDSQLRQYNAVHHYEGDSGQYVDILDSVSKQTDINTLVFKDTSTLNKVTFTTRLRDENQNLRRIKVIKPGSIEKFVSEFNRLLIGNR